MPSRSLLSRGLISLKLKKLCGSAANIAFMLRDKIRR